MRDQQQTDMKSTYGEKNREKAHTLRQNKDVTKLILWVTNYSLIFARNFRVYL